MIKCTIDLADLPTAIRLAGPLPSMFEDDTDRFTAELDKHCAGLNDALQIPSLQKLEDAEMLRVRVQSALEFEL